MTFRPSRLLELARAPMKWGLLHYEFSVSIGEIVFLLIIIAFVSLRPNDQVPYVKPAPPATIQIPPIPVSDKLVVPSATVEPVRMALPIRLKIPTINVDTAVEYVGLMSDDLMDVPKNPLNVAWYEFGPRPGENGSAVIDGHSGTWIDGTASAFDDLSKLRAGDKVFTEDNKGVSTTFIVQESRSYDPQADASGVFSSSDGKAHLNLITCEGTWNDVTRSYPARLVVFTVKE